MRYVIFRLRVRRHSRRRVHAKGRIGFELVDPRSGVLIVVDGDHGQAALMVDSIQDQRQVVVKSLEANYRAIDGLAGATILGDGRVALILDIDTLTARRPVSVAPIELAA